MKKIIVIREPRLAHALALAIAQKTHDAESVDVSEFVIFEDDENIPADPKPIDMRNLPHEGNVVEAMAIELGVADEYYGLLGAVQEEIENRKYRRAKRSFGWAASYMYGVESDRMEVLRTLVGVAHKLIWFYCGDGDWDNTRKGLVFEAEFPEYAQSERAPWTLDGCAKMDFFRGVSIDEIWRYVERERKWFEKITKAMVDVRTRLGDSDLTQEIIEGKYADYRIMYLVVQTHFDVSATFELFEPDLIVAHSPSAQCTGIFTHHTLDLHAAMESIHSRLEELEPGCWALVDNPDGATPREVTGTLSRRANKISVIGAEKDKMFGVIRKVAADED
ncbi:MAG: hypothetical protein ABIH21_01590 [Patescibacteria group bacterium]